MKKTKKKIKVRDMKPKKNPRAGGIGGKSVQGNKFVSGTGKNSLS
jgi:hypothetical protein